MQTVGHDNKFHQIIVGRCTRGLQDKDILATHIFVYLDTHFTIAESANVARPNSIRSLSTTRCANSG